MNQKELEPIIAALAVILTIGTATVGVATAVCEPYYIGGHVYMGTVPVSGADVMVTDLNTSESLATTTDSNGAYVVALGNLPSEHSAGDHIQVRAIYNGMTNATCVIRSANPDDSPQIVDIIIITDTDHDGVPDVWDMDNSTPAGYWVNSDGVGRMWGDMNGDGRLTSVDALMILQTAVGRHPGFPTRGDCGGGV